ncbi:hypothetical protein AMJ44_11655 [candidate division WOR-1 bacterium DG_54_3]|uniref:NodB homology domain-containing protein n=1 Tax=candidate division WOR-1 bacterium DG_54_3 TaxID=1703775 RepID=A0A0S7XRY7_UNCSA|nr:MAG: hypothetical protein AMJ44_11655 [candidate division WOR-1 bacterium DG_54_3]
MICLTGDVHHMSMKGANQPYLQGTEVEAAERYLEIAGKFKIKSTLFFTGKCILEEYQKIKHLPSNFRLELGGHTYRAFKPRLPYKLSYRLLNRKNGPFFLQRHEIRKTVNIFKEFLDYNIVSWRDHAYRNDKNTPRLLKEAGIEYFSDIASPRILKPFLKDSLFYVPINVLPDNDYVYHGSRKPGSFNEDDLMKKPFQTKAMTVDKWLEKAQEQVKKIIDAGGISTLLVHPTCMEIADNFKTFGKLCHFLSQYETLFMREIGDQHVENFK